MPINFSHDAPLALALLGLLMGMRHATDPDHVIAVTTIVSRERGLWKASGIGAVWGLGHTATVLAFGALIIIGKLAIPARLGLAMELAVAIVLILLGLQPTHQVVRKAIARLRGEVTGAAPELIVHSHAHRHGAFAHRHLHVHAASESLGDAPHSHGLDHEVGPVTRLSLAYPRLRAFGVGLVHGLAGSAAIALLVLSAIPDPRWAALYLMIFCVGTILGMALITSAIAAPIVLAQGRVAWLHQGFVSSAGLLSFGFGLILAYQIIVSEGLLSATPYCIPH